VEVYGCGVCVEDVWRRVGVDSVWCVGVARMKGVWRCVENVWCVGVARVKGVWRCVGVARVKVIGIQVYMYTGYVDRCVCIVHVVCAVCKCVVGVCSVYTGSVIVWYEHW